MIVTKTEFAALAKVSPGRVSQWIADGRIGPDELEGKGRGARINAEAAAKKLKIEIDLDISATLSITQRKYLELTLAVANCCTAATLWESEGPAAKDSMVAAGMRIAHALAALPLSTAPSSNNKRGPRPQYDSNRAKVHLVALASSVDGLPDNHAAIVDWLRDRLTMEGSEVPSDSTLRRWVSEFLGWALSLDQAALQRFHNSPALQRDFDTPEEYLQWCAIQNRMAHKWLHDGELQAQFTTPSGYIASMFENYSARNTAHGEDTDGPKVELRFNASGTT